MVWETTAAVLGGDDFRGALEQQGLDRDKGRAYVFSGVTRLAGRDDVGEGMRSAFAQGSDVILGKRTLRPTV